MEFSFLWIILFTVGYVMQEKHRKEREQERENEKLLIELGEEKFLKVAKFKLYQFLIVLFHKTRTQLPSWVTFPATDRAEWINRFLNEMWPNLNSTAMKLFQENVEPLISNLLADYHISGFRLVT